jgi:L-threonylcarbamoyladenylate synthase
LTILREVSIQLETGPLPSRTIRRIAAVLKSGGVIAYPTETVYGLGSDYLQCGAARRIAALKRLETERPLLLLVPHDGWLEKLTRRGDWDPLVTDLVEAFWPGPVTILIPAADTLPGHLIGRNGTIALRNSPDPFVSALLRAHRSPITSTSANPTGKPPAVDFSDILSYFSHSRENIDVAVDGGPRRGAPSTLVSVATGRPRILREGAVPSARIEAICRS